MTEHEEQRRRVDLIWESDCSRLYIGPFPEDDQWQVLRRLSCEAGMTVAILNFTRGLCPNLPEWLGQEGNALGWFPARDGMASTLGADWFRTVAGTIETLMHSGYLVYAHCVYGQSRSVAAVAAWLVVYQAMTAWDAVRFIRERRPLANPSYAFVRVLQALESVPHQ